jgi:nitrate reductase gamma subunit
MTHLELLTFARGSVLNWALMLFVAGILLRLFEVFSLGRKADLAVPRTVTPGSGWRTMFTRSLPAEGMLKREPVTYISGYVFHTGLFLALFFLAAHIELFRSLTGLHWPALPTSLVDAAVVAAIVALLAQLANRLSSPVKRMLSTTGDYVAWAATLLPLLTGYMAYHHMFVEYTLMLALHVFSVEFLLVVLPFTKLFHAFSLFISRWYNGDWFARKGVAS